ncbi:MAG: hypothetical protein F082_1785 [bacterium F082]|nr:MAG: hypothetical protein F082_1785 [bacterium F082]
MSTEDIDIFLEDDTDYSTTIDRDDYFERLSEKIAFDYNTDHIDYETFSKAIYDAIDEQVKSYTKDDGKMYVDDWEVFDFDMWLSVIRKLGLED